MSQTIEEKLKSRQERFSSRRGASSSIAEKLKARQNRLSTAAPEVDEVEEEVIELEGPAETAESLPRTEQIESSRREMHNALARGAEQIQKKEDDRYKAPARHMREHESWGSNFIPPEDEKQGVVGAFGTGVARGAITTFTGTASGALQAAGDLPMTDGDNSKVAGIAASELNKFVQRGLSVDRNPDDEWGAYWADVAGAGVGSVGAFLAGGIGIKAGLKSAALTDKAIRAGAAAGGAAFEALVSGANAYDAAKEAGATPWEAAKAAAEVSATTAATSFATGKVAFADNLPTAVKVPVTAAVEGGQEVIENISQNYGKRHYEDNYTTENLTEGWIQSFVGGFVGGATIGGAVNAADAYVRWGQDQTGAPVPEVIETSTTEEEGSEVDQTPRLVTKEEAKKIYEGLVSGAKGLTGAKKQQVLNEANKWKEFNERKPQKQLNLDHPEPVPVPWGRNEGMELEPIEVPLDVEQDTYLRSALTEQLEQDLQTADPAMQEAIQAELDARNAPQYGDGLPYVDPLFESTNEPVGPPAPEQLDLEIPQEFIEKEAPTGQIPYTNQEHLDAQMQQLEASQPPAELIEGITVPEQVEMDIPQTRYELAGSEESWFKSPPKQMLKAKFQGLVDQANEGAEPNAFYAESMIVDPDGTEYYLPGDITEHVALLRHFGYQDVMDAVADGWITYSLSREGNVNLRYDPAVPTVRTKARSVVANAADIRNINGFSLQDADWNRIDSTMEEELATNLKWLEAGGRPPKQIWPASTQEVTASITSETPVRHPLEDEIQGFMGPEMGDAYISVLSDIKLADDYPFRGPVSANLTPGQAKRVAQVARYLYETEGVDPYEAASRAKAFVTGEGDSRSSIEQSISTEFDETDADLLEYPTEEGFEDLDDLQDLKHTLGNKQLPTELTGPIEEPIYEIEPWDITRPPVRGQAPTAQEQEYVRITSAPRQAKPSTFPEPRLPGDKIGDPKSIAKDKWSVPEVEPELPDPFEGFEDPEILDPYTQQDSLFDLDDAPMPTRTATQQPLMSPGALQFPTEYPSVTGTTINILGQDVELDNVSESVAEAFKNLAESPVGDKPIGKTEAATGEPTEQLTITAGTKNPFLPLHRAIESKGTLGEKVSDQLEAVRVRANLVLGELTDLYVKAPLKKLKWDNQIKVGQLLNGADVDAVLSGVESNAERKSIVESANILRKAFDRVDELFTGVDTKTRAKGGKHLQPTESTQEADKGMGGLYSRLEDYFPRLLYSGKTYGNVDRIIKTEGVHGLSKIGEEILYNMQTQYGVEESQARKALAQWIDWRTNQVLVKEGQAVTAAMVEQFPDMINVLGSLSSERMEAVELASILNKNYRSVTDVHAPMFGSIEAKRKLDVSPFADPNPLRVADQYFNRASQRFGEIKQLGQFNEKLEDLFEQTHKGSAPTTLLKKLADEIRVFLYDDEKSAELSNTLMFAQKLQTNKLKLAWIGNMMQSVQTMRIAGVSNTLGAYKDFVTDWNKARSDARRSGATADIEMRPSADLLTMGEGGVGQGVRQLKRDVKNLGNGGASRLIGDTLTTYAAWNSLMHRETEYWNRLVSNRAGMRLAQKMHAALTSGDTKQIQKVQADLEQLQVPLTLVEEFGSDSEEFEYIIGEAVNRTVNFTSDKLSRPKMVIDNQFVQMLAQFKTYTYGMQELLRKNFNRAVVAAKQGDHAKVADIIATEMSFLLAVLPATGVAIGWMRNLVYDIAETAYGETVGAFLGQDYEATRREEYEDEIAEKWEESPIGVMLDGAIEAATLGLIFGAVDAYEYGQAEGIIASFAGPAISSAAEGVHNVVKGVGEVAEQDTVEEMADESVFHLAKTIAEGLDGWVKMFGWDPYEENKEED